MAMTVELVDRRNARALGLDFPSQCFAFSPDYLAAIAAARGGEAGVFVVEDPDGRAFAPVVLYRRRFLALATLLAAPADAAGRPLAPERQARMMEAIVAHAGARRLAHRFTQPMNWALSDAAPPGSKHCAFGSYRLRLDRPLEEIWSGLHQKHRNAIRAAERAGVDVREGPDQFDACFRIYSETMIRNGMGHDSRDFLQAMLGSADFSVFCAVSWDGDRPLSAIFAPYNRQGAYYLHGGSIDEGGKGGANNLLHYQAIRAFHEAGARVYDFVGARVSADIGDRLAGIQRFKARFGGDLHEGLLWKQDVSPAHCLAYDALVRLRGLASNNPPSMDIIDQESLKAHGRATAPAGG